MAQCVPSWNVDDPPNPSPNLLPSSSSTHFQLSMSDCEVAELTWSNGHLLAHGLVKPTPRYPPFVTGTLESVVNQATLLHPTPAITPANGPHMSVAVDALVPTGRGHREDLASGIGSCDVSNTGSKRARVAGRQESTTIGSIETLTGVDSCGTDGFGFATTNSVTPFTTDDDGIKVSGSPDTETTSYDGGGESRPMVVVDDHDSVCHSRRSLSQREMTGEEVEKVTDDCTVRSTISTKRSRAAAIHNQSERKRRDRINQKIRTLQKLVPNSNKTDKASMLDEVIEYLKQLQVQISMMSRMSSMAPPMMMPMSMQQFQMSMMAQTAQMAQMAQMGMARMGMMDMGSMGRIGPTGVPPVMPPMAFLPMIGNAGGGWDAAATAERMQQQPVGGVNMTDPFSVFVPCPTQQPMTMDAYQRMTALYQQMFQQNQPTNPK